MPSDFHMYTVSWHVCTHTHSNNDDGGGGGDDDENSNNKNYDNNRGDK